MHFCLLHVCLILHMISVVMLGEECNSWSFSSCSFLQSRVTSTLSGPKYCIFHFTLFSSTLSLRAPVKGGGGGIFHLPDVLFVFSIANLNKSLFYWRLVHSVVVTMLKNNFWSFFCIQRYRRGLLWVSCPLVCSRWHWARDRQPAHCVECRLF
jgi:hypothetical protein